MQAVERRVSGKLRIPDLVELLAVPGSEDPDPAIELMAGEIEASLVRAAGEEIPDGNSKLELDLERLRSDRKEALEGIELARELGIETQVIAHQRLYASRIPERIVRATEAVIKDVMHRDVGILVRIWGRDVGDDDFHAETLRGTTTVAIAPAALRLIRDKILAHQDKLPFKRKLKVMVKGKDPFIVMKAGCGAVAIEVALIQW